MIIRSPGQIHMAHDQIPIIPTDKRSCLGNMFLSLSTPHETTSQHDKIKEKQRGWKGGVGTFGDPPDLTQTQLTH